MALAGVDEGVFAGLFLSARWRRETFSTTS
jgi:hypothetical protein